jgi:hypothetical protein
MGVAAKATPTKSAVETTAMEAAAIEAATMKTTTMESATMEPATASAVTATGKSPGGCKGHERGQRKRRKDTEQTRHRTISSKVMSTPGLPGLDVNTPRDRFIL